MDVNVSASSGYTGWVGNQRAARVSVCTPNYPRYCCCPWLRAQRRKKTRMKARTPERKYGEGGGLRLSFNAAVP